MSEQSDQPNDAAAAPAAGGGKGPLMTIIAVSVVMLGAGFGLSYFIIPGLVLDKIEKESQMKETEAAAEGAAPAEGGEKAEAGEKASAHGAAPEAAPAHGAPAPPAHGAPPPAHGAPAEAGKEAPAAPATVEFTLRDMVVNTAGSRGARFVKISLSLEGPAEVVRELESRRAAVTDMVSTTVGGKTADELTGPKARGELRSELLGNLNALLKAGRLENVYFLELLVQ